MQELVLGLVNAEFSKILSAEDDMAKLKQLYVNFIYQITLSSLMRLATFLVAILSDNNEIKQQILD